VGRSTACSLICQRECQGVSEGVSARVSEGVSARGSEGVREGVWTAALRARLSAAHTLVIHGGINVRTHVRGAVLQVL